MKRLTAIILALAMLLTLAACAGSQKPAQDDTANPTPAATSDASGEDPTEASGQKKLDIQPGSMSEIAAKLEHKGLLCREKDPADKRKILLTLTDAGRADVEAFQMSRKMQHTKDFDALTQEEQQQLSQLLEKLLDSWSAPRENEP